MATRHSICTSDTHSGLASGICRLVDGCCASGSSRMSYSRIRNVCCSSPVGSLYTAPMLQRFGPSCACGRSGSRGLQYDGSCILYKNSHMWNRQGLLQLCSLHAAVKLASVA